MRSGSIPAVSARPTKAWQGHLSAYVISTGSLATVLAPVKAPAPGETDQGCLNAIVPGTLVHVTN